MASHKDTSLSLGTPGMASSAIPSRVGYGVYKRYEPFIKDCLAAWPNPVDFTPETVSVETFAKTLRNAIRSVLAFQWKDADIDIGLLATIWPAAIVSSYPTGVRFGPRDAPRAPAAGRAVLSHSFELNADDPLAVKAAIVLLSRGKFSAPVLLHGDPSVAETYITANDFDVAIQPAPEAGPESFLLF